MLLQHTVTCFVGVAAAAAAAIDVAGKKDSGQADSAVEVVLAHTPAVSLDREEMSNLMAHSSR